MRKILCIISVALLALTACTSSDDNPATPDLDVKEKIIGKWVRSDVDGQPVPTNEKMVITFVSTTQGYLSAALNFRPEAPTLWANQKEVAVAIEGNKVTVTNQQDEHTTGVEEHTVTAINDNDFSANHKVTVTVDGNVEKPREGTIRLVKVNRDYRESVLGLWECTGLTGIETYNDANARLEFLADGTYRYYRKNDGGEWQAVSTREFQNYFVDGTLLATRWKNQGEDELREWWEIASLADGEMTWIALRQNADGTTAQQGMTWKKVN